jgi:hypothetical protein
MISTYLKIYKTNQTPRKEWGEGRVEARILQTNVLYCIQGPCFVDNESPA